MKFALAALVLAVVVWQAAAAYRVGVLAARLPALPDLRGAPDASATHLREADRAARAAPWSVQAVGDLCMAYHAAVFPREAERCYARAAELAREGWQWTYYRALLLESRGEADGFMDALRRVLERAPGHSWALYRLGEAQLKRGDYAAAIEAFNRLLDHGGAAHRPAGEGSLQTSTPPIEAYAAFHRARAFARQGDSAAAVQSLEQAIKLAPAFGAAHRLMADVHLGSGRASDAERHRRLAAALPPYVPPPDPAVDDIARHSRSGPFLLNEAALAARAGDRERERYYLSRASRYVPTDATVRERMRVLAAPPGIESRAPAAGGDAEIPTSSLRNAAALDPDGERMYLATCALCHHPSGSGLPGHAPPLAGSRWVGGPLSNLTRIVLDGYRTAGAPAAAAYAMAMPSHRALDDEQVAAILTHVVRSWGERSEAVDPAAVAAVRAATAARQRPWTQEELADVR